MCIHAIAQNPIVTENSLAGNPSSEWDIVGAGDLTIQGFATDISVNKGQTIRFKIKVNDATSYTIRIYRIGYYQGNGARLIANLGSFAGTNQPNPITSSDGTGLVDCSNWSESASWAVPSTAVSGVYIARLTRNVGGGSSHIIFIVRDDAGTSDLLFKTSDATWQAYNVYGGNSLYVGTTSLPSGHAAKVSYNRPFLTRNGGGGGGNNEDWFFSSEYPTIRFLERNGYNVSYTTDVDMDRNASPITPSKYKVLLSVGHDEYWSAGLKAKFGNARNAGVHLAFFSGNEVYWKTRWENNFRTLVCYKEGTLGENQCGFKCDPTSTWTGLWRSGAAYDAGQPENELSGNMGWTQTNNSSITVPFNYRRLRFWRNTSIASLATGQTATFPGGSLGYEWDFEHAQYVDSYPRGRIIMSSTTLNGMTHKLSLYRHTSGALVFGAGTIQWGWGLDDVHDNGGGTASVSMQQATLNLFADMGVQPATRQANLVAAAQSTDLTAPSATITSPTNGATFSSGATITISGSASDAGGGVVAGVEVSVDGGNTWRVATAANPETTVTWTYSWVTTGNGNFTIRARGFDDSGNMGNPGTGINVTVGTVDNTPPTVISVSPVSAATGVSVNTSVTANFNEAISGASVTASTFQLRDAGNNLVTATRNTSGNQITLIPSSALTASTSYTVTIVSGASGVKDLAGNALANNYTWSFTTGAGGGGGNTITLFQPQSVVDGSRSNDGQGISLGVKFRTTQNGFVTGVRYYKPAGTTGTHTGYLWSSTGTMLASATFTDETASGWQEVLFSSAVAVTAGVTYVASYHSPSGDFAAISNYFTQAVINGPLRGLANGEDGVNGLYRYSATPVFPNNGYQSSNYWADVMFTTGGGTDVTPPTVASVVPANGATGVSINTIITANFSEALNATTVTGTTFQLRNAANNLISATLNTSSNQVTLTPTAALAASSVYTVTITGGTAGVKDLAGNALASNFSWSFTTASVDNTPPTVTSVSPTDGATGIGLGTLVNANFSESINAATVTGTTFQLRNAANNLVTATLNTSANQVTLTPSASLNASTTYTATITGGASGVKDLAGNALASNYSWSFTTSASSSTCPCSVFQPTNTPAFPLGNDGQGIVVGMKFRSTENGFITGVRYYKGSGTTGSHIGSLWTSTGSLLAQATFINETASGWQQVLFSTPVAIAAGVTYVVSNFSPSGHYAYNNPYFTQAVVNGPLRALADGEDGPNGLYRYSATSVFPNSSYSASNYWVDVVFNTSGGSTLPTVTTHPSSQTTCSGSNVSFSSAANGTPTPTIQWQESTNGTTWTNISGATNSILNVAATTALHGRQYRAVWTNSAGPVNSNTATLTVNAIPSAPAVSVVNNCGNSVLTATGFTGSLLWSTGATTTSITVNNAGTYTVTQTAGGCTSAPGSGTAAPKAIPAAPSVEVINNCTNSVLSASNFSGALLWNTGANTASITVNTGGIYTVTQTIDGCTSIAGSGTAAPKPIPAAPSVSVTNNCGNSVLIATGFTGSLLWSTGATTASITVNTAGTYTVTQNVNGCTSSSGSGSAAPLNSSVATPSVDVVDNCGNSILTATGYTGSLLWSTGATTASITINTAGTYTVTQTVGGCTSAPGSGTAAPKAIPAAPLVGVVNNCTNSVLTASNFSGSLLWNTEEITTSITVTTSGTYTVTQTVNGCTSTAGSGTAAPKPIPAAPSVSVTNNCGNSVLTATGFTGSLLWSTGATTASITVNTAGTYSVTQTVNGCTSAPGSGTAAPLNSSVVTPIVDVVDNCGNSVLTASEYTGSLLWSTGAITASITVNTAGTYTVTQTVGGCTSAPGSGTATPKAIPAAPTVGVVNNCTNSVLTASNFSGSLLWITGETTASITVNTGGTYTVTQTVNGCTSTAGSSMAAPKPLPPAPSVSVSNNCGNSVLTATGFTGSLLWSTGATTSSITVNTAGTYTVTQTVNGCTSTTGSGSAAPINSSVATPVVNVVNNCGNSVLTSPGSTGDLLWNTGETTPSISVTTAGTYTVTQTENGCTSAAGSGDAAPKPVPVLSSGLTGSASSGVPFAYAATSFTPGTSFSWSRAAVSGISNTASSGTGDIAETLVNTTTSAVNVIYEYTLTADGCPNTQNVVVTVNSPQTTICNIDASITTGFNNTAIPAGRYIWFNSVFDRNSFTGITGTVDFYVTNSRITFSANNQQYTLNVPDAHISFDAAITSASTQFVNNVWRTTVPRGYTNFVFMTGLPYQVPVNFPANINNITWTADIGSNKTGVTISWKWAAAVYTNFAAPAGLNIKPIGGTTQNPYPNSDKAGTPENFKTSVVSGAKGGGGSNYTGNYSGTGNESCTAGTGQRPAAQSIEALQPAEHTLTRRLPDFPVDLLRISAELNVQVLPNPTSDLFNLVIKGNSKDPVSIKIIDVYGRTLEWHEKIAAGKSLSLGQGWRSGTYFAEVAQGEQRKVVKIIKAN